MDPTRNTVKRTTDGTPRSDAKRSIDGTVDHGALKSNQLIIITLSLLAFVLNSAPLVAGTALVMAAGTFMGKPGFHPVYSRILLPLGLLKPEVLPDNPSPHRFAQGFGGIVLLTGAITLFSGAQLVGWALVWLVIFLAAINAFAGFCAGCFLYYQLGRLGVAGFTHQAPEGTRPGFKPSNKAGSDV